MDGGTDLLSKIGLPHRRTRSPHGGSVSVGSPSRGCRTFVRVKGTDPLREIAAADLRRWRLELALDDSKTAMGMETLKCLSPRMAAKELLAFLIARNLARWVMAQSATTHDVPLERISFTGALTALAHFTASMNEAKTPKARRNIWDALLRRLAEDLVPNRPGRREPRAVKRRPKPYPRLNKPRRQFRENGRRAHCTGMSCYLAPFGTDLLSAPMSAPRRRPLPCGGRGSPTRVGG